jgi:hypothetical protein
MIGRVKRMDLGSAGRKQVELSAVRRHYGGKGV